MIVRMMGDTSLKTVMDHYFDSSVEHMQGGPAEVVRAVR
jgi:hypothetical protein